MVRHYESRRQQQVTLDICSDLLNAGGYMTHRALDWRHHPNVCNIAYYMTRGDLRWNDTLWQDYSIPLVWRLHDQRELQGKHFNKRSLKKANLSQILIFRKNYSL